MKKTWFQHFPMDEKEANMLINHYHRRGIRTEKSLTDDPRFFVVSALLPVSNYIPRSEYCYINPLWRH